MKARRIGIRLDEAEWSRLQALARDHGVRPSGYIRALLSVSAHDTPTGPPLGDMAAAISRLETLMLAATVSAYETQSIARAALTPEQTAALKKHRAAQFAAWRAWGVRADYIGLDMRPEVPNPKTQKEPHHE